MTWRVWSVDSVDVTAIRDSVALYFHLHTYREGVTSTEIAGLALTIPNIRIFLFWPITCEHQGVA